MQLLIAKSYGLIAFPSFPLPSKHRSAHSLTPPPPPSGPPYLKNPQIPPKNTPGPYSKGFSPLCVRRCRARWNSLVKPFPQPSCPQTYGLCKTPPGMAPGTGTAPGHPPNPPPPPGTRQGAPHLARVPAEVRVQPPALAEGGVAAGEGADERAGAAGGGGGRAPDAAAATGRGRARARGRGRARRRRRSLHSHAGGSRERAAAAGRRNGRGAARVRDPPLRRAGRGSCEGGSQRGVLPSAALFPPPALNLGVFSPNGGVSAVQDLMVPVACRPCPHTARGHTFRNLWGCTELGGSETLPSHFHIS